MTADWEAQAACKPYPLDWFFPVRNNGRGGTFHLYDAARTICRQCPVRAECLADALEQETGSGCGYRYGMFGGLTPNERYTLDRHRRWQVPA
jgi:WhiB family redox-sensing transcriptional regulator